MRTASLFIGALCALHLGCSSDSSGGSGAGSNGGAAAIAGSSSSSGGNPAAAGGGSGGSSYCQEYCTCYEANCAAQPIPGGASCLDFCATFSEAVQQCRLIMCKNVPSQPNNNHCAHAIGVQQCTM
jgi:hypothetical protein